MGTTVTGFAGLVEVSRETYKTQEGYATQIVLEGTKDAVIGAIPLLNADTSLLSFRASHGPKSRITANYAEALDGSDADALADLSVTWTLEGADFQASLYEHPKTVALGASVIAQIRAAVKAAVKSGSAATSLTGDAKDVFDLLVSGVESFEVSQWVLRRTQVINRGYATPAASANVNKVYTTDELKADELIPVNILFELPAGEWKKDSPTITQRTNGSFEQLTSWKFADSWSSFIYERKS